MPNIQHRYVFVLWGKKFEEAPASIFVTELRQAGLRVKIVGLDGQFSSGTHGLTLVPDLTLSQAFPLVSKAVCVIVPCMDIYWKRFADDPRIVDFLRQAFASRAQFVIEPKSKQACFDTVFEQPTACDVTVYPDNIELVAFARNMAHSLLIG